MGMQTQQFGSLSLDPGVCPICLTEHALETPHNLESLFYRCTFYGRFKRWPTWEDASAHCSQQGRTIWLQDLLQSTYSNTVDKFLDIVPN